MNDLHETAAEIDLSGKNAEEAALTALVELRDVGFGRHRIDVLLQNFGETFGSEKQVVDALESLRGRGLVAKSHSRDEFYYRPTEQGIRAIEDDPEI